MSTRGKYFRWLDTLPAFHQEFYGYTARMNWLREDHLARWFRYMGIDDPRGES